MSCYSHFSMRRTRRKKHTGHRYIGTGISKTRGMSPFISCCSLFSKHRTRHIKHRYLRDTWHEPFYELLFTLVHTQNSAQKTYRYLRDTLHEPFYQLLFTLLHSQNQANETQVSVPFIQCCGSESAWIRNFCLDPDLELLFWIRIQLNMKQQTSKM